MQLDPVESSMLAAIGYDPDLKALVVLYNSGKAYQYQGVPEDVFQGLINASSKGRYMLDHVIDHYQYAVFKGWKALKPSQSDTF